MKQSTARFFIVSMMIFFIVSEANAGDDTLVFAGIDSTIPFSYKDNGGYKGIFCDITDEIIRRLNVDAKVELLSFALILRYLKDGTVDGCFMLYRNKERESFALFSDQPVLRSSINVYVIKGQEFPFQSVKDLFGKRVGKQANFFTSKEFVDAVDTRRLVLDEARTCELNLKKLIAGRIDCYVGGAIGTYHSIKELGVAGQVVPLSTPLVSGMETYFAISKASKRLTMKTTFMERLNMVIHDMYEDGTIQRIEDGYLK